MKRPAFIVCFSMAAFFLAAMLIFYSCKKDYPRVAAVLTESMDKPSALASGKLIDLGQTTITDHGFCWDNMGYPSVEGNKIQLGNINQTGDFSVKIPGLSPNIVYYLKAFIINENETVYGDLISFTTPDLPSLTTAAISDITIISAVSGGTVNSDGGSPVTARGICWNTSPNPDLSVNHTSDSIGTGVFVSIISGLTEGTKYFVRSYASNYYGTRYGNEVNFIAGQGEAIPVVTTAEISNIGITAVSSGGEVVSDGGFTVTMHGVCWSLTSNPTTSDSKTEDGGGTGQFVSSVTGLIANTKYYLRAYAINEKATGYGEEKSFTTKSNPVVPTVITDTINEITTTSATSGGSVVDNGGAPVTARGICWSTTQNPTIANPHTNDGSGTGEFVSSLTDLTPGTPYYVRAYATNSVGTAYGEELNFSTSSSYSCGSNLIISHIAGSVAPVSKEVTYGTVTNIPGEPSKCWITSNLGADHQAASVDDSTEASAGWYWQFNKKQGYKHDGITRTPNTIWITNISENSDWIATNDPCMIELGSGWRIPTYSEWLNVSESGSWGHWYDPWNSDLKLHAAGDLSDSEGFLSLAGHFATYHSSSQLNASLSWPLYFYSDGSGMANSSKKAKGSSIRCVIK